VDILESIDRLDLSTLVRAGDLVVCGQGLAEPVTLTRALVRQRRTLGEVRLFVGPTFSDSFTAGHTDGLRFVSWCATGGNAALRDAGALDILPTHYSMLDRLFAEGTLQADVVLLLVSEPDADGRWNLGLVADYTIAAARRARTVILEISDRVPWVYGAELPADVSPALAIRSGRPPQVLARRRLEAVTEQERAMAAHACALIPDGATIELGIGSLPELVLDGLRHRRDLGIHSGAIGDGVAELMQAGVITNRRKPIDPGISVAGLLMGGRALLDYAHRNARLQLRPPSYTHDAARLAAMPDFYAVNGAIEADLTGQVNAESIGGRYVGAVGGMVDFTRGGNASPGGRAIVLLPSTARGGTVSRIVPELADGTVTIARSDAGTIVTEWGVADLRGKTLRERAAALAAISHPKFRDALHHHGR
jgi:acetyl-CoA hydrolase